MATKHPRTYKNFVIANIVSFIASTIAILLLSTAGGSDHAKFVKLALLAEWVSMGAIAITYGASFVMTNPNMVGFGFNNVVYITMGIFVPAIVAICVFGSKGMKKRLVKRTKETLESL